MTQTEAKFDVVFRGDIVLGQNLLEVKQRLQQLFKADAAKINALFSGRPIPLKKNLDEASAKKYQVALTRAGAEVSLVPSAGSSPAVKPVVKPTAPKAPAPETIPSETIAPKTTTPEPVGSGFTLAAVGSNVSDPNQKNEQPKVNIDVSAISLRENEGNLMDAAELQHEIVAPVQVPDFDVAEVGSMLVRDDEKTELPIVEIEPESWDLSELGADLLQENERQSEIVAEVQELQVDLAPVGSDLGQQKQNLTPVNPDISQLKLVVEKAKF